MKITVLVHSDRLGITNTEYSFWLPFVGKVNANAAMFSLHIDEGDVMPLSHRMSHTTHLNLDVAIVDTGHHGEMLLYAGVNGVYCELFHLLTTTYHGNFRVYNLLDYITTMFTFEKFYSHNSLLI